MKTIETMIRDEIIELNNKMREIRAEYKRLEVKEGELIVSKSHGTDQYYQFLNGKRVYIRKKHRNIAAKLAQRDYDKVLLEKMKARIDELEEMLQIYETNPIDEAKKSLCESRRVLTDLHFMSDDEYVKKWQAHQYTGKGFFPGDDEILTNRGERVRSKTEKIIADKLFSLGIPYRYECPLNVRGFGVIFPDFTVLDVITREEIYYEHLGMMDFPDYVRGAIQKIKTYEKAGIFVGDKLLLTYEVSGASPNMDLFEKMILNRLSH